MKLSSILAGVAALTCASTAAMARPGADVIVGDLPNSFKWAGIVQGNGETLGAYSVATTSCNIGTVNLNWIDNSVNKPVIGQNFYRIKSVNGGTRFEQIGGSWLKHGFCALQGTICLSGSPSMPSCSPTCGSCCQTLGIGCSDPYSNSRNGEQQRLGPRTDVNPWTGQFAWPYTIAFAQTGNSIFKRGQVWQYDLNPALNVGATYYVEGQYVARDDALAGNQNNNASYRRVLVGATPTGTPPTYNISHTGSTVRTLPAIWAWQAADPTNVVVQNVDDPAGGRVVVGYNVTDLGNGTWHYEYAIHNLTSDRAIRRVSIPVPTGVNLTNVEHRFVPMHSGEPKSSAPWTFSQSATEASWTTEAFVSNANANAITWGFTYNFRFDADQPPETVNATLRTFKVEADLGVSVKGPSAPPPPACPGDANGDNMIDAADLSVLLSNFGQPAAGPGFGDFNGDGQCDGADLSVLLGQFGSSC